MYMVKLLKFEEYLHNFTNRVKDFNVLLIWIQIFFGVTQAVLIYQ